MFVINIINIIVIDVLSVTLIVLIIDVIYLLFVFGVLFPRLYLSQAEGIPACGSRQGDVHWFWICKENERRIHSVIRWQKPNSREDQIHAWFLLLAFESLWICIVRKCGNLHPSIPNIPLCLNVGSNISRRLWWLQGWYDPRIPALFVMRSVIYASLALNQFYAVIGLSRSANMIGFHVL